MPNYVFRDDEDVAAYQYWPTEESVLLHPDCAQDMWEREFPLYVDDLIEMSGSEPMICDRCEEEISIGRFEGKL